MTKRTKRVLFYSALVVFLVLSYISVLYAQGYKYSFSDKKFYRTGAISLRTNSNATILINDKPEGSTFFLTKSYSIDRLLPDNYKITVIKDDYAVWKKKATVEEGLVIDFPHILLLPEEGEEKQKLFDEVDELFNNLEPNSILVTSPLSKESSLSFTLAKEPFLLDAMENKLFERDESGVSEIATNVKGFRVSKNKNKIAWWTINELWIMWLENQNYQPFRKKGDRELITRFQIPIENGIWFRGENHLILELEQTDSKNRLYSIYKVVEIDTRGGINIVEL